MGSEQGRPSRTARQRECTAQPDAESAIAQPQDASRAERILAAHAALCGSEPRHQRRVLSDCGVRSQRCATPGVLPAVDEVPSRHTTGNTPQGGLRPTRDTFGVNARTLGWN